MPRVSLIMPVFNAIADFERGNGQFMLPEALSCILNQTFTDFELIILDNISTDGTFEFLQNYALSDKRIRLVQDSKRRNPEEAISYLSSLIESKYCCIVNDDDYWEKNFLSLLYTEITSGGYDLVYPSGYFIDINSNIGAPLVDSNHPSYDLSDDCLSNFTTYLKARNPIPISFGIFQSSVFKELYPTGTFDVYRANVDNLFILRIIMSESSIKFLNTKLFYYRNKVRMFNPVKEFGLNDDFSPVDVLENLILHQFRFQQAIQKEIELLVSIENQISFVSSTIDSLRLYIWKMLVFVLEQSFVNKGTYDSMVKICFAIDDGLLKSVEFNEELIAGVFRNISKEPLIQPRVNVLRQGTRSAIINLLPLGQRIQLHYFGYRLMRAKTRLASRPKLSIHR